MANIDNIDYLEKIGYEELNQARPGEKQYVFIGPKEENLENIENINFWSSFMAKLTKFFSRRD